MRHGGAAKRGQMWPDMKVSGLTMAQKKINLLSLRFLLF